MEPSLRTSTWPPVPPSPPLPPRLKERFPVEEAFLEMPARLTLTTVLPLPPPPPMLMAAMPWEKFPTVMIFPEFGSLVILLFTVTEPPVAPFPPVPPRLREKLFPEVPETELLMTLLPFPPPPPMDWAERPIALSLVVPTPPVLERMTVPPAAPSPPLPPMLRAARVESSVLALRTAVMAMPPLPPPPPRDWAR